MSGVFSGNQWTAASGSTWSVIIEPDFVNQVAELCNHLSLASQENRSACEKVVERAQQAAGDSGSEAGRKEVVKDLVGLVGEKGLNQGAEAKDIEGFTNLATSLVNGSFKGTEAEELLVQLSGALSKSPSNESGVVLSSRYSSLSSLFNSLPDSTSASTRSSILLALFKLAVSHDDISLLSSAILALPRWLSSEWGISDTADADKAMGSFVNALEQGSDKPEAGETIRKLLLEYANENTEEELKSKLLLYTLASSTTFDIEGLPTSSSNGTSSQLREIFLSGSHSDLSSFLSSNKDLTAPLEAEKLQEKLQYILLADFASKKVGSEISYDEIASALGLDTSGDEEDRAMEVESWIIATIRANLLTARLHQPTNTASIIRASPRRFGSEQWQTLQTRLEAWKSSVGNILDVVGRAVGPAPGSSSSRSGGAAPTHDAQTVMNAASETIIEVA